MTDDWKFLHIGVVVKDLDQATQYLKSVGIEPIAPPPMGKGAPPAVNANLEIDRVEGHLVEYEVNGQPADPQTTTKCKFFSKGNVLIEVVQPVKGKTIAADFLASQGDGLYHFCFAVDDFDKELARFVAAGSPIVSCGKTNTGSEFAYVDTRRIFNFMLELGSDPCE
jgi:catechol 2,3-dioxygenase-like lactoylglutathione lyase family enzyme